MTGDLFCPVRIAAMVTYRNNQGQGLVEYALILTMVAIVVLVVLVLFGPAVGNIYSNVISQL